MSHVHVCSSSRRRWHAALHGDSGSHRGDKRSGIPPHAGKTYLCSIELALRWDHPCACGENFLVPSAFLYTRGSPPRMRGKRTRGRHGRGPVRITPAHAGKTQPSSPEPPPFSDHPRACGENLESDIVRSAPSGSPPRMRGKRDLCGMQLIQQRITPAHAGKTWRYPTYRQSRSDHPRACGENPEGYFKQITLTGSPPRMRGKLEYQSGELKNLRITPAHAGKTKRDAGSPKVTTDNPRACGENLSSLNAALRRSGSPPRMRGKPWNRNNSATAPRITPAHAGKTF